MSLDYLRPGYPEAVEAFRNTIPDLDRTHQHPVLIAGSDVSLPVQIRIPPPGVALGSDSQSTSETNFTQVYERYAAFQRGDQGEDLISSPHDLLAAVQSIVESSETIEKKKRVHLTLQQREVVRDPDIIPEVLARRARVDVESAKRYLRELKKGTFKSKPAPKSGRPKKCTPYMEVITTEINRNPRTTLRELADRCRATHGFNPTLPPPPGKTAIDDYLTSKKIVQDGGSD